MLDRGVNMDYEVIVVGGGPVGMWLAAELALANVSVCVIERLEEPSTSRVRLRYIHGRLRCLICVD